MQNADADATWATKEDMPELLAVKIDRVDAFR
jgi:hypothetical protein